MENQIIVKKRDGEKQLPREINEITNAIARIGRIKSKARYSQEEREYFEEEEDEEAEDSMAKLNKFPMNDFLLK